MRVSFCGHGEWHVGGFPLMVNIEFVGQLVDSMDDAVEKMESAIEKNKTDEANRMRTFIFDLHCQLSNVMGGKNV